MHSTCWGPALNPPSTASARAQSSAASIAPAISPTARRSIRAHGKQARPSAVYPKSLDRSLTCAAQKALSEFEGILSSDRKGAVKILRKRQTGGVHFTAIVTPDWLVALPTDNTTGRIPVGTNPPGT